MNAAPENMESIGYRILPSLMCQHRMANRMKKKIDLRYQPRTRDENKPDSWIREIKVGAAIGMTCMRLDGASEINLSPIRHGITCPIRKTGDRMYRISGTRMHGHYDTITVRTPSLPVERVPGCVADISPAYLPVKLEWDGTTGQCRKGER